MRGEKVAVIDGGGRGSALVRKYLSSQHVESVIAIPGNEMMKIGAEKPVEIFPEIKTSDIYVILDICRDRKISFVDVAQDNAVAAGLVDLLRNAGINTLGPTRAAGEIEWSKAYAREFGTWYGLPQPEFMVCTSVREGEMYISRQPDGGAWFVKADGLYEGKGALPARDRTEAKARIGEVYRFKNDAGKTYLIEDWMRNDDGTEGEEFSAFGISDGKMVKIIGSAQDHKRVNDFDEGENTGGTGCSAQPLALTPEIHEAVKDIFNLAIGGLVSERKPYNGILYLGGIIISEGGQQKVYVVEWNARWGDPEAQVIVPGIRNDFLELGKAAVTGGLGRIKIETDGMARVAVAGMARGYPGDYRAVVGKQIYGLDEAMDMPGIEVYGAGVHMQDGKYYANGGRLFYVVGTGLDTIEARGRAYGAMSRIFVEGNNLHYRNQIGWRNLERELRQLKRQE